MADESSTSADLKSLRTVFIGTNIIFWILAIFMINILIKMNKELVTLNQSVRSVMAVAGSPNLDGFEIVDGSAEEGDDAKVIYRFQRAVMPEDEYMDEMGMEEGSHDGHDHGPEGDAHE